MLNPGLGGDVVRVKSFCPRSMRQVVRKLLVAMERFDYYVADSGGYQDPDFVELDSFEQFEKFMNGINIPIEDWQKNRFANDPSAKYVALVSGANVLCRGWITNRFTVKQRKYANSATRVLYDFVTPEVNRHHGYYTRLLRHLASNGGGMIYVNPRNEFSVRAIESSGFKMVLLV